MSYSSVNLTFYNYANFSYSCYKDLGLKSIHSNFKKLPLHSLERTFTMYQSVKKKNPSSFYEILNKNSPVTTGTIRWSELSDIGNIQGMETHPQITFQNN